MTSVVFEQDITGDGVAEKFIDTNGDKAANSIEQVMIGSNNNIINTSLLSDQGMLFTYTTDGDGIEDLTILDFDFNRPLAKVQT